MMADIQYDLFKETTETDELRAELEAYKTTLDKVRKGTYAEIRALQKMVFIQQEEIDHLKVLMNLMCKLDKKVPPAENSEQAQSQS